MSRAVGRPSAALGAALAVALTAGCSWGTGGAAGEEAPAQGPAVPERPPSGFLVAAEHREHPAGGGAQVAWSTAWRLSWDPVPGARGYAVRYRTSEGTSSRAPQVQAEAVLRVEAAAGTSPRARLERDRRAGLLFTSSQLLVQVAAQTPAGQGPSSAWFPVGDVPASGRPVGTPGQEPPHAR